MHWITAALIAFALGVIFYHVGLPPWTASAGGVFIFFAMCYLNKKAEERSEK